MTTIIANEQWMWADRKAVGWDYWIYSVDKIIPLPDWTLFAMAWRRIEPEYILKLYKSFIIDNLNGCKDIVWMINFTLTIKENSNIKDFENNWNEYLFCNDKYIVKFYTNWAFEIKKTEDYLSIGSGSEIVAAAIVTAKTKHIHLIPEDIFEIVSSMDNWTSPDFDFVWLKKSS